MHCRSVTVVPITPPRLSGRQFAVESYPTALPAKIQGLQVAVESRQPRLAET